MKEQDETKRIHWRENEREWKVNEWSWEGMMWCIDVVIQPWLEGMWYVVNEGMERRDHWIAWEWREDLIGDDDLE